MKMVMTTLLSHSLLRRLRLLFCASFIMLPPVVHRCLHLHLFPRLCRHTSASCCVPLVRLVVAFPSTSASPSHRASARRFGLRHSSRLHLSLHPSRLVHCHSCLAPPPLSRCSSARCRLSLHPFRSVGLSHCSAPRPIIRMAVVLPLSRRCLLCIHASRS